MIIERLVEYLKIKWEIFIGWIEVVSKYDHTYKYVIESIELREHQGKLFSIIHYKLIGCRKLNSEKAADLNRLTLFSLFRPDHAQIIVSIATAEAIIGKNISESQEKYKNYIEFCNNKLGENIK